MPRGGYGGSPGRLRRVVRVLPQSKVLKSPRNKEYKEIREWMGKDFDPEEFDMITINEDLAYFYEKEKDRERVLASMPKTKEEWLKEILSAYRESLPLIPPDSIDKIYLLAPKMGIKRRDIFINEEELLTSMKSFLDEF